MYGDAIARLVIVLGVGAMSCKAGDLVTPVDGTFHSDHLGVTLTFPAGWTREHEDTTREGSKLGTKVMSSKFLRGASVVVPEVIILFDIGDTPVASPPSAERLVTQDARVFETVMAKHPDAAQVGTCSLIEGVLIDRCVAHSPAPLARTLVDYTWYLDGRHVGMRVMSSNVDEVAVLAESDAIARSVH